MNDEFKIEKKTLFAFIALIITLMMSVFDRVGFSCCLVKFFRLFETFPMSIYNKNAGESNSTR